MGWIAPQILFSSGDGRSEAAAPAVKANGSPETIVESLATVAYGVKVTQ